MIVLKHLSLHLATCFYFSESIISVWVSIWQDVILSQILSSETVCVGHVSFNKHLIKILKETMSDLTLPPLPYYYKYFGRSFLDNLTRDNLIISFVFSASFAFRSNSSISNLTIYLFICFFHYYYIVLFTFVKLVLFFEVIRALLFHSRYWASAPHWFSLHSVYSFRWHRTVSWKSCMGFKCWSTLSVEEVDSGEPWTRKECILV